MIHKTSNFSTTPLDAGETRGIFETPMRAKRTGHRQITVRPETAFRLRQHCFERGQTSCHVATAAIEAFLDVMEKVEVVSPQQTSAEDPAEQAPQ